MIFSQEIFLATASAAASGGRQLPGELSGAWLWAVMLVPPSVLWMVLAVRRVWLEDATRPQRAARRELEGLLGGVVKSRGAAGQPTKAELEAWCGAVVRLWKIDQAAPSADEVAARGGDALGQLWAEAEEAMYSGRGELRADWMARAIEAMGGVAVPIAPWPVPKLRRHWLPVAMGLILMTAVLGAPRAEAAEIARKDATSESKTKGTAAGAGQKDKSGLVAAQGAAAYLQRPRDAAVRDALRQSLAKVEGADAGLVRLLDGAWYDRVVGRLTPREWERVARSMALLAALGFTAAVMGIYFGRGRRARMGRAGALLVGAIAASVAVGAWGAWLRYGLLTDVRVAMIVAPTELKMIPSEIGARQPAANLVTGALVMVDQSFLGWDHVVVRGATGNTNASTNAAGWVRTEQVGWLYQEKDYTKVAAEYAGAGK